MHQLFVVNTNCLTQSCLIILLNKCLIRLDDVYKIVSMRFCKKCILRISSDSWKKMNVLLIFIKMFYLTYDVIVMHICLALIVIKITLSDPLSKKNKVYLVTMNKKTNKCFILINSFCVNYFCSVQNFPWE